MRYRLAECLTQEGRSRSSNAAQSARGYRAVCAARTGRDGAVGRRLACTRTPLAPGEMLPRGSSLWRRWSLDAASGRENVTCSHSTFGGVRTPMAFALRFGECGGTKLAGVCGLSFPSNLRRGGLLPRARRVWFARQFGCGNAIRFSEGRRGCRMRWARLRSSSRAAARTARSLLRGHPNSFAHSSRWTGQRRLPAARTVKSGYSLRHSAQCLAVGGGDFDVKTDHQIASRRAMPTGQLIRRIDDDSLLDRDVDQRGREHALGLARVDRD